MTTDRMQSSTLKIATMAGLAGAGLALLFAPRSGRETRGKIKDAANNMKHHTGEKVEHAKEMKDRAVRSMAEGTRSAKEKYQELRENSTDSGKEQILSADNRTNNEEEI